MTEDVRNLAAWCGTSNRLCTTVMSVFQVANGVC